MTTPARENPVGVSSIELFFDLVFVFVITQVTQRVEHAHGTMDFLRALLVLVLIAAMAGFLTMPEPLRRHPAPRRIEPDSCGARIRRRPQARAGMFRDAHAATVS